MLPFVDFGLEVDVVFVGEPPVEFLLVGTVQSFDLTLELRRSGFDVGVTDAQILDMPAKLHLEFVAVVRADLSDAEWGFWMM